MKAGVAVRCGVRVSLFGNRHGAGFAVVLQ